MQILTQQFIEPTRAWPAPSADPLAKVCRSLLSLTAFAVAAMLMSSVSAQPAAPKSPEIKTSVSVKDATETPIRPVSPSPMTVASDPWPVSDAPTEVSEPPAATLPSDATARVAALAAARWNAIAANQYEVAFNYFSPASKEGYSAADLSKHWSQFMPKSARVQDTKCSGEVCTIMVFVDGSVRLPRVGFTQQLIPSIERWAWNGATFHLLRK